MFLTHRLLSSDTGIGMTPEELAVNLVRALRSLGYCHSTPETFRAHLLNLEHPNFLRELKGRTRLVLAISSVRIYIIS
jgi:hypothetical protein